jgi:transaldolase
MKPRENHFRAVIHPGITQVTFERAVATCCTRLIQLPMNTQQQEVAMSLKSLIATGTKVWLDGVEPGEITRNRAWGVTGATSNPTIVAKIIESGHFDGRIHDLVAAGLTDEATAWELDDELVRSAQREFLPVWERTRGNDGYVSFELDPLIEDNATGLSHASRVERYVQLGKKWAAGHNNRMIKVPATDAGLEALEPLAAAGVTINVTLMFTARQYRIAREAIWNGALRRQNGLEDFKSVYSVFVSRVDSYVEQHLPELSDAAREWVGIENAKWIWRENEEFWRGKGLRLQQEIVFASTGVKKPGLPVDKYVVAFAGGGIQTNPSLTNEAVQRSPKRYGRGVDRMPPQGMVNEIDSKLNVAAMEEFLMKEGIAKFAGPQRAMLRHIAARRSESTTCEPVR